MYRSRPSSAQSASTRTRRPWLHLLSGLTIRGRCLLAAGVAAAVCAVLLNERDLLRIAVFVVALPLLMALPTTLIGARIKAIRTVLPERVPVGGHGEVQLDVWRAGRLPAGTALLVDGSSSALGGRRRFVVERIPRHRSAMLRYPVQPTLRGIHRIGPLQVSLTDPFGLYECDQQLITGSRLVVVPRVVGLHGLPDGYGTGTGGNGSVLLHAAQGDPDVVVRPYRQGDDLRKVHWRSTARRDEVMVRVDEQPRGGGTTVLLDHRAAIHQDTGTSASLEWAVEFTASACLHLNHAKCRMRLVNGHGRVLADAPGDGNPVHDRVVLDALAELQPARESVLGITSDPGQGQALIAVLSTVDTTSIPQLIQYRPRGTRNLAVLLHTAEESTATHPAELSRDTAERTAALLRAAGWGVVLAHSGHPIPRIWSDLCRTAAAGTPARGGGL